MKRNLRTALSYVALAGLLSFFGSNAHAQYFAFEKKRAEEIQNAVLPADLQEHLASRKLTKLKIAILDNGFGSFEEGEDNLPESARLISDPAKDLAGATAGVAIAPSDHGLAMAQTLWAMTGLHRKNAPQIYLVNAHRWTNFKNAVDWCIENKIDIILFAQNFEIGNLDGSGYVSEKVNEATKAGILWVNAAGNYRDLVYNGPINVAKNGKLRFNFADKKSKDYLEFSVENDSTPVTISLSWNDLPDDETEAVISDLDLKLYDDKDQEVTITKVEGEGEGENAKKIKVPAVTNYRSDGKGKDNAPEGDNRIYSPIPREFVEVSLRRGDYRIRVLDRSQNFVKGDKLRVLLLPDAPYNFEKKSRGITFTDKTLGYEIFTPADNKNAITVGEFSDISSRGPNLNGDVKPDVLIRDARIELTDGSLNYFGSSTAAAIFAGTLALMRVKDPDLDRDDLTELFEKTARMQRGDVAIFQNPAATMASNIPRSRRPRERDPVSTVQNELRWRDPIRFPPPHIIPPHLGPRPIFPPPFFHPNW